MKNVRFAAAILVAVLLGGCELAGNTARLVKPPPCDAACQRMPVTPSASYGDFEKNLLGGNWCYGLGCTQVITQERIYSLEARRPGYLVPYGWEKWK